MLTLKFADFDKNGDFYGILDFYAANGFDHSTYNDWFWEILFEKYAKGNKCGIWISYIHVYEKQRYMGVCS